MLQRMINALEPGTYCQPHKHENPDKVEAFILLTGKLLVVEFDDAGTVKQYVVLSHESGSFGGRDPCQGLALYHCVGAWHCGI